jgi:hypothetical protein
MMRIAQRLAAVWTVSRVVITGLTACSASGQPQSPRLEFTGVPRDIDFLRDLVSLHLERHFVTQVVLHAAPTEELIATTENDRIVRILLLALMLRRKATVKYLEVTPSDRLIVSATLELNPQGELPQVAMLSFGEADNLCRATIIIDKDNSVNVWTESALIQGILETAARDAIPVLDFDWEAEEPIKTMEIVRGKVNRAL